MRCGAKCFLVEIRQANGEKETIPVNARTAAGARKVIREELGSELEIMSVRDERRTR